MKVSDRASGRVRAAFKQPNARAAKRERDWAADWFMSDCTPRVIVSRSLKVLAANSRALEMIAASDFLSICDGRLLAAPSPASLDLAVANAGVEARVQLMGEVHSGILVTIHSAADEADEPVFLELRDLSFPVECVCADLRPVFDLSAGEQSAILGLLRGQSPREIAVETHRSVLTVRTLLKRAYVKIGVRSVPQLFARLFPYAVARRTCPRFAGSNGDNRLV